MAKSFLLLNECDVSNKCGARCLMAFNWKGQCVQEGKVSKRANFQLGRDDMHFVWFSMRDGFFSPRVFESRLSRVARLGWYSETSGEKSISHGRPYKMHFLAYFTL